LIEYLILIIPEILANSTLTEITSVEVQFPVASRFSKMSWAQKCEKQNKSCRQDEFVHVSMRKVQINE